MANNTTDLPTQHDLNDQPTHDIGTYQQYNTVNSIDNPQEHDLEFCTDTAISWFFLQDLSGEHGPVAQLQEHLKHWDGYWQRSGYMVRSQSSKLEDQGAEPLFLLAKR